jgi:hypothetical protein
MKQLGSEVLLQLLLHSVITALHIHTNAYMYTATGLTQNGCVLQRHAAQEPSCARTSEHGSAAV